MQAWRSWQRRSLASCQLSSWVHFISAPGTLSDPSVQRSAPLGATAERRAPPPASCSTLCIP